MACGLAVLLSIDVLAMGAAAAATGRAPAAGHPQHAGEHPERPVALPVFVGTALLFLRLRGHRAPRPLPGWGREATAGDPQPAARRRCGRSRSWLWSSRSWSRRSSRSPTCSTTPRAVSGPGGGGSGYQLTSVNPFIRLRRDLVEKTHTPLVYAETEARVDVVPPHHRARPVHRRRVAPLATRPARASNRADGVFPNPPGLAPGVGGTEDTGASSSRPNFSSTWLPLPYPIRELDIDGHLALRRADPRRRLRRRRAAAELEYERHVVHARRSPPSCWSPRSRAPAQDPGDR